LNEFISYAGKQSGLTKWSSSSEEIHGQAVNRDPRLLTGLALPSWIDGMHYASLDNEYIREKLSNQGKLPPQEDGS
jgi:hypothetical protein